MTTPSKIRSLAAALILTIAMATPAMAVVSTSGTTNVSVTVPECIILHYYSSVTLNFATPDSEALNEGSNSVDASFDGTTTGGTELAEANLMNAALELDGSKTTVKLSNVWAVRGFSASGSARVEVAIPAGKSTMSREGSEISVSNVKVRQQQHGQLDHHQAQRHHQEQRDLRQHRDGPRFLEDHPLGPAHRRTVHHHRHHHLSRLHPIPSTHESSANKPRAGARVKKPP